MFIPNDLATCALIKILWDYHTGNHVSNPKPIRPEWVRNPIQEKILAMCTAAR